MAIGANGRTASMGSELTSTGFRDCACSILNAREEKLLDDESRVQVRLICNRCGTVLDSEVLPVLRRLPASAPANPLEAAEGA